MVSRESTCRIARRGSTRRIHPRSSLNDACGMEAHGTPAQWATRGFHRWNIGSAPASLSRQAYPGLRANVRSRPSMNPSERLRWIGRCRSARCQSVLLAAPDRLVGDPGQLPADPGDGDHRFRILLNSAVVLIRPQDRSLSSSGAPSRDNFSPPRIRFSQDRQSARSSSDTDLREDRRNRTASRMPAPRRRADG